MRISATFDKEIYKTAKDGMIVGLYKIKEIEKCGIITGKMLPTDKGVVYSFEGEWVKHPRYGKQFKAEMFEENLDSCENIVAFLASPLIKGIGPKTAIKIVDTFGDKTLEMMDADISCLLKVKGFPKKKFDEVKESYQAQRVVKEVVTTLGNYGISSIMAVRAYKCFGENIMDIIRNRPYELSYVDGISFHTADKIGYKIPGYEHDYGRFCACAYHVLFINENGLWDNIIGERASGSNGMNKDDFGKVMMSMLLMKELTGKEICEKTLRMIVEKKLVCVEGNIYTYGMAQIEKFTARKIKEICLADNPFDFKHVRWAVKNANVNLNMIQIDAVNNAFTNNLSVIIGVPGSGKTTTINTIAAAYNRAYPKNKMYFFAPSGKAASRIKETLKYYPTAEVSTIHAGLKIDTEIISKPFEGMPEVELENSLVVIDEASMLDSRVAYRLFASIKDNCRVVICGDDEQLQSVGSGAFLRDLIDSKTVHVTELTQVYRQGEESDIFANLYKIREGDYELSEGRDFFFKEEEETLKMEDELLELYYAKVEEYGMDNVMLICPFNRYDAGVHNLNVRIQEHYNPDCTEEIRGVYSFRVGDVVMQLKNDYTAHVMNGDIGKIVSFGYGSEGKEITVDYGLVKKRYDKNNIDELCLAYAYTIHKAQGSEAKCVITCVHNQHGRLLKRNVYYTALTRARKEIYIFGQKDALKKAITTEDNNKRITLLRSFLQFDFNQLAPITVSAI